MKNQIIGRLKDNFIEGTEFIIEESINDYTIIACSETNLKKDDERLVPHIKSAVIKTYIRLGNEGILSSNESGFNVTYEDIEEQLRKNIISLRVLP